MRFLFTCIPAVGHLHAMMPYAHAMKDQGHEVAFATGSLFAHAIQSSGFLHYACGTVDASSSEVLTQLPEWASIQDRFKNTHPGIAQLHAFIEVLAPRMLTSLCDIVSAFRPHLIVRDPLEFGGYIAAEIAEIPHALVAWATHIPAQAIAKESLCSLRHRHGLGEDPDLETLDRHLILSALPSSWKYDGVPDQRVLKRYQIPPYDDDVSCVHPLPTIAHCDRPLIYVTLGTTFNSSPETFNSIISALDSDDFSAIVTVGHSVRISDLGAIPNNVHVANYIPQTQILRYCDAVIFHAGFNSLHSALWHGLPMILIPMGAGDQLPNAMQAVAMGVGLIEPQPLDIDRLRHDVRLVLTDPLLRSNARRFQAKMEELPPISEAVQCMVSIATVLKL